MEEIILFKKSVFKGAISNLHLLETIKSFIIKLAQATGKENKIKKKSDIKLLESVINLAENPSYYPGFKNSEEFHIAQNNLESNNTNIVFNKYVLARYE